VRIKGIKAQLRIGKPAACKLLFCFAKLIASTTTSK
jgi:hypothetical protein